MKKILIAAALGACLSVAGLAQAANVGVSINIGDPGYYGSIDINNYPQPQFVNPAPVVIQAAPGVALAPLYLHVPVEHYSHWRRYCSIYQACGRPVYFIHPNWYSQVYAPRYRTEHQIRHEEIRHEEIRHEEHREAEHERHEEHREHEHDRHE